MKFIKYCFCCLLMLLTVNCSVSANVDYYMKVVILGDCDSGKTAIWKRLIGGNYDENKQCSKFMQADSFIENVNGSNVKFKIWDTVRKPDYNRNVQYEYCDEMAKFAKGANLILIVHDICRPSFDGYESQCCEPYYMDGSASYLQKVYGAIYNKIQPDGKIVLVGSKYDKRHEAIVDASKQIKLLESVASTIPCQFIVTSSKENLGIKELREFIMKYLREEKKVSERSCNYYNSVIRFIYDVVLDKPINHKQIPMFKKKRRLPKILSEVSIYLL